jgi:hypothetical protein
MKDGFKIKTSLHLWKMIPNYFIVPLPVLVRCKTKAAAGDVWAIGNKVPNCQLLYRRALK